MTQINNASDLIRNINAGSKFELAGNGQIKTQGWLSSFLQGIRDKFRSAATINARQARLDDAMANMLRSSEPMPDITQPNLYQAQTKISPAFAKTLEQIQSRLYAPQPSTTNTTSWQPQPQFQQVRPGFQQPGAQTFRSADPNASAFGQNTGYTAPNTFQQNANGQLYQGVTYKSKVAAGLLGIFLGCFGVHNFYLGYTTKAIIQLLLSVLSCGTLAVVSEIWGLIEGIMILSGSIKTDAKGLPLKD